MFINVVVGLLQTKQKQRKQVESHARTETHIFYRTPMFFPDRRREG